MDVLTPSVEGFFFVAIEMYSFSGAGCRDRTRDPVITNHVLYQLS
jgi:hypothetical protein